MHLFIQFQVHTDPLPVLVDSNKTPATAQAKPHCIWYQAQGLLPVPARQVKTYFTKAGAVSARFQC